MNSLQWRAKKYAEKLIELDRDIDEIVLIGSLVNGNFGEKSDIDILCLFDEERERDGFWEKDLLAMIKKLYTQAYSLREKLLPWQKSVGINHPIDLGFMIGSDIFMGGGLISRYIGKYRTLAKRSY